MTSNKQTRRLNVAARFGSALAAMYAAPQLPAAVVELTFTPGSVPFQSQTSNLVNVQIGPDVGSFSQWNDSIGQTLVFNGGLTSWAPAFYGSSLSTGSSFGTTANILASNYVAFRAIGNVGWFAIDLGPTISYGPGCYGSLGEPLRVGQLAPDGSCVAEPVTGGLALLGLGALGLMRKRGNNKKMLNWATFDSRS